MEYRKPTQHRMTRRAAAHDYTRPGIYHITLHVADGLGQPLGAVVGRQSAPDGSADAPRVALTTAGQMVEHELLTAIHTRYPMVLIQDYVIMPDHLHFLLVVEDRILSINGKTQTIGQIIAGFKQGCNRQYWQMMDQQMAQQLETAQRAKPVATLTTGAPSLAAPSSASSSALPAAPLSTAAAVSVPGGFAAGVHPPLFAPGFCDVMPIDAAQLATQRAYIAGNPRNRLLRSITPSLHIQRGAITTALTPSALRGYLQRECPPHIATPEVLATIESRLLLKTVSAASGTPAGTASAGDGQTAAHAGSAPGGFPAGTKRVIACDAYGDRTLLSARRCLPVVCHRKDAARFAAQKARCLAEAARGTVLISARIAKGEQAIIDEAQRLGYPVALILDNGFPDRFHPSADRLALCAEGRLLLITLWSYEYRPKGQDITVPECKAMNCLAQAICRTKDSWWQAPNQ